MTLVRRDNNGGRKPQEYALSSAYGWDPFRMMDALFRTDPFRDLGPVTTRSPAYVPKFDVKETKDGYVFHADLPGVKEADLDVSLTGNILSVNGHRESQHREEQDHYYTMERTYGEFSRSFVLPEGADPDSIKAELKDGVLDIRLSKKPEVKPRKISVGANEIK